MSVSVITETALAHTHLVPLRQSVSSLFTVPDGLLVVEKALPFCTSIAVVSSKSLCFVYCGTNITEKDGEEDEAVRSPQQHYGQVHPEIEDLEDLRLGKRQD